MKNHTKNWIDTARIVYWTLSIAGMIYLVLAIQNMHSERIAYEAATQNVTNRLIGRLEGAGEKRVAKILEAWQNEVKIEKAKAKKANFQEF